MDWGIFGTGLALFVFFAQGGWKNMPDWMKWPGIVAGILFIILGGVGEMFPSLKIPKGPIILFIISIVALISSIAWYIDIIKSSKSLNFWILSNIDDYPSNIDIGGIKWNQAFADVRVYLENPTNRDYTDLDVLMTTDLTIAKIGQITNLPNVTFTPVVPGLDIKAIQVKMKTDTGKNITIPVTTEFQYVSTYRMICPTLPRHSRIGLVLAVVVMNPIINGKWPDTALGEKRLPKWVSINGHYKDSGREYPFEQKHSVEDKSN